MISSKSELVRATFVLLIAVGGGFASGQDRLPRRGDPKTKASQRLSGADARVTESGASAPMAASLGIQCAPYCDYCLFETTCSPEWQGDGECDCGCQFADWSDCGVNCFCPTGCDWCWCNTSAQGSCPPGWDGDGECDCGCQFTDSDCGKACACPLACEFCWCDTAFEDDCLAIWDGDGYCDCGCEFKDPVCGATGACCTFDNQCLVRTPGECTGIGAAYAGDGTTCEQVDCADRCPAGCERCWMGTSFENDCILDLEGDGVCDCGCQFDDPDCGPRGACCLPRNGFCEHLTAVTCELYFFGVFQGVGVDCAEVNCDRCDPGCTWCWRDTFAEHACLAGWEGDGECDCSCQFADSDCAAGVCGNLVCEEDATSCDDDCKDVRSFAGFQNCFNPGAKEPPSCFPHRYAAPPGVGLEDYAVLVDFISGPWRPSLPKREGVDSTVGLLVAGKSHIVFEAPPVV